MWIHRLRRFFASDFAFRQDTTLTYLPIVIAFLTLLSICMTHSSAYIKHVTLNGSETLKQRLHLHIPYDTDDMQLRQLYDELATISDIEVVDEISRDDMKQFLGSWLSINQELSENFPIPKVIDIILRPDAQRDTVQAQLDYYLKIHIPDALLESYDDSIAAFNQSAQLVKMSVYILGLIVLSATTMIVVIISRISLGVHHKHIQILHHLGANDHYINRQFIRRTAIISGQGVLGGTFLSIVFIEIIKSRFASALMNGGGAEIGAVWLYYIINPALIMVLVLVASWVSIEAQLKKMH